MFKAVEAQTAYVQTGFAGGPKSGMQSFSDTLQAFGPAGVEAAGQASGSGNVATLSSAVITGAASAPAGANAYGMGMSSPFSSGGYGVPSAVGSAAGGSSGSFSGAAGTVGGSSSEGFMQQDYLLNKMRETNMEMITIQAEVQSLNRDWSTRSNILKAKHDTEMAQVRNFRVT